MDTVQQSMTARDYLRILFRQKAVIIICVITAMAIVVAGLFFRTPVYEAKVKLLVSAAKQVESPYYRDMGGLRGSQMVLTQSQIVKSNPVMQLSVNALGLNKKPLDYEANFASFLKKPFIYYRARRIENGLKKAPAEAVEQIMFQNAMEELKNAIEVEPIRDTDMFTMSVRDYSPVGAAIIANVVSRAYLIFDLQQQLAELQSKYGEKYSVVLQLKDNIDKMAQSLSGQPLSGADAIGPASVKVIEQATMPTRPVGLPASLILIIASFMSVLLGVTLAFVFEYLDQTFKSPRDIETYLNVPFLGCVPRKNPEGAAGLLHCISDHAFLMMKDRSFKTLLLASAEEGDGVSKVIANMGLYLTNTARHRVLLIDANLRNPRLHGMLGLKNDKGLGGVLEDRVAFDNAIARPNAYLSVMTAGKTDFDPMTLLASRKMDEVLKQAKEKYDIVLIDAPVMKSYRDSLLIASHADAVCLVISEGKTRRQVLENSIAPFRQAKTNIIGAILNDRSFVIPQVIYKRV